MNSEFAVDVSAKKFTRWHTHRNPEFGKKGESMFVLVEGDRCAQCKAEKKPRRKNGR